MERTAADEPRILHTVLLKTGCNIEEIGNEEVAQLV